MFVYNKGYEGDIALSLQVARQFVGDDSYVVCMGERHLVRSDGRPREKLRERP